MDKEWLAHYFVTMISMKNTNMEKRYQRTLETIEMYLEQGWELEEIKYELDQFAMMYPQLLPNIYHIEEIMANKQPPNNLINPDIFYYHNALRITSEPPRIYYDEEQQCFVRKDSDFFLEIKKRFTMKDLLTYWYNSNKMKPTEHNIKQDTGRFEYLLTVYDLDEVLYMIDITQRKRKENQMPACRNVFEIEKHIEDAREMIKLKKNEHRKMKIDRVFPLFPRGDYK